MRIRLGLFEKEGEENFFKELQDMWGKDFVKNKEALLCGITDALRPLDAQFKVILERENLEGAVAFNTYLKEYKEKETELCVQIYFWPLERDSEMRKTKFPEYNFWFVMGDPFTIPFPVFDLYYDEETETMPEEILRNFAYEKARLITSDIARDGVPKKIKRSINEIKSGLSYHVPNMNFNFFYEK
jgi:hypothetical protein